MTPREAIVVVVNRQARSSQAFDLAQLERLGRLKILETSESGDAARFARDAPRDGVQCLLVAGGDGTIAEVVQAVAADRLPLTLGALPLGTGNDFVSTLGLSRDPTEAAAQLSLERAVPLDVLRMSNGTLRYSMNAITGGFSAAVDEKLEHRTKRALGRFSFIVSAGAALPELTSYRVRLTLDDGETSERQLINFVVANGRSAGGGIPVAPAARPDDGLADVLLVPALAAEELQQLARALLGAEGDEAGALRSRARKIHIDADPPMELTTDGEPAGSTPVTIEVEPGAVRWLVGPDFGRP